MGFTSSYLCSQLLYLLHIYLLETVSASSYRPQSPYSLAFTNKQTKANATSFSPNSLLIKKIYVPLHSLSPDGGIGRRAGLKHQWSNPSRFDPGSGYINNKGSSFISTRYDCFLSFWFTIGGEPHTFAIKCLIFLTSLYFLYRHNANYTITTCNASIIFFPSS